MTLLTDFLAKERVTAGVIQALGAVSSITTSYYDLGNKKYLDKKTEEDLEIVSFFGLVALLEDKPMIHAHGSFSDVDMNIKGGHIKELFAGATTEVVIERLVCQMTREHNSEVGLNILKG